MSWLLVGVVLRRTAKALKQAAAARGIHHVQICQKIVTMANVTRWRGIPVSQISRELCPDGIGGYVAGLRRLADIEIRGTFDLRSWVSKFEAGTTFWCSIPNSKPRMEVRCIVIKLVYRPYDRIIVLRPIGAPRRKHRS